MRCDDDLGSITELLSDWSAGDTEALHRLAPLVYSEIREIARRLLRGERPDHTLQPTALVSEFFLRVLRFHGGQWQNRDQFFGYAATAMRRILVDCARARRSAKRGGGVGPVVLDPEVLDPESLISTKGVDLESLDEALERLSRMNERQMKIVEMRAFLGLDLTAIAEDLGVSRRTVDREWASARAWLYRELRPEA